MSVDIVELIDQAISSHPITIFSKTYCPYCVTAKKIIAGYNKPYFVMELDTMSNGGDIQKELIKRTKLRTVPQIFIAQEFIGGCDDLQKCVKAGKLESKLEKAFPGA